MKNDNSGREQDPRRYDDLLNLEHPVSRKHPRMSMLNRAAQFSPFAALTGYETQIRNAQKIRVSRILLSEEEKIPINRCLKELKKRDFVQMTWFEEDPGTDGSGGWAEGAYRETEGEVLRIDPAGRTLRVGDADRWEDVEFENIFSVRKK